MNRISHPGVCDLGMNTVTVLGVVSIYAQGSFTGGNLDGRLLFFSSFDLLTHRGQSP